MTYRNRALYLLETCFRLFHSANVRVYSDGKEGYVFTLEEEDTVTRLSMKFKISPPEGQLGRLWSRFNHIEGDSTQYRTADFAHELAVRMRGRDVPFVTMYQNPDFNTAFELNKGYLKLREDDDLYTRIKTAAGLFESHDEKKSGGQYKIKLHDPDIKVKLCFHSPLLNESYV